MNFSIIIPTYKRKKYLNSLLKSLLTEKKYIREILILNTSEDTFLYKNKLIKVIKNNNLLVGKNICLKKAQSNWVLILDDDLILYKNILQNFYKAFHNKA